MRERLDGARRGAVSTFGLRYLDTEVEHLRLLLENFLCSEEQKRLQRFVLRERRNEFLVGRALVRALLAVSGAVPRNAPIQVSPLGRPRLRQSDAFDLDFNLSHSRGHVIVGFSSAGFVGVDVECGHLDKQRLARRVLDPRELLMLERLGPEVQDIMFRRIWMVKEAWSKARGDGVVVMQQLPTELKPAGRFGAVEWRTLPAFSDSEAAVALIRDSRRRRWISGDSHQMLRLRELTEHCTVADPG